MEATLVQFYKLHNPVKIKDIPKILRHYRGAETLLLANLRKKYGDPGPTALMDWVVVDFSDTTEEKKHAEPGNNTRG